MASYPHMIFAAESADLTKDRLVEIVTAALGGDGVESEQSALKAVVAIAGYPFTFWFEDADRVGEMYVDYLPEGARRRPIINATTVVDMSGADDADATHADAAQAVVESLAATEGVWVFAEGTKRFIGMSYGDEAVQASTRTAAEPTPAAPVPAVEPDAGGHDEPAVPSEPAVEQMPTVQPDTVVTFEPAPAPESPLAEPQRAPETTPETERPAAVHDDLGAAPMSMDDLGIAPSPAPEPTTQPETVVTFEPTPAPEPEPEPERPAAVHDDLGAAPMSMDDLGIAPTPMPEHASDQPASEHQPSSAPESSLAEPQRAPETGTVGEQQPLQTDESAAEQQPLQTDESAAEQQPLQTDESAAEQPTPDAPAPETTAPIPTDEPAGQPAPEQADPRQPAAEPEQEGGFFKRFFGRRR